MIAVKKPPKLGTGGLIMCNIFDIPKEWAEKSATSEGEAFEKACENGDVTVACGSLYLYKDMAEFFKEK